ncbi:MAG TPA: Mur ligase family protein [Saprospiraceae bacterium]|nr:Mur ligase family protein [Saprospiraceae bacterium]
MRIHIIAIGGSVMHSLAIQLKLQGHEITGSDDIIYDPARSHLRKHGLLPENEGWFSEKVDAEVDLVVVGKHAHEDNPELKKANDLGLKVQSFPEFVYERSLDKKRIVVAGSHGKTTTTGMLMEVLKNENREFDYLVGAPLEGFERSFKLTASAPYILIEGDEYPTASFDPRPKFVHYRPHYTIITGIAWDHMNAFPSLDIYHSLFDDYLKNLMSGTHVIYNEKDEVLSKLVHRYDHYVAHPYNSLDYEVKQGKYFLKGNKKEWPLQVIGKHNIENMAAVIELSKLLDIKGDTAFQALTHFSGAARRLETVFEKGGKTGIVDFAHAPSKVKASIRAVKEAYPNRRLIAVIELHTYSSLNKDFLKNYRDTLDHADEVFVFYSPETLRIKRLPELSNEIISQEMGRSDMKIHTDAAQLFKALQALDYTNSSLLMMSSGAFGKSDVRKIINELLE